MERMSCIDGSGGAVSVYSYIYGMMELKMERLSFLRRNVGVVGVSCYKL